MNRGISRLKQLPWPLGLAGLTVVILWLFLGVYSTPAVHAEEPPDDCWGGTLSAGPLHCLIDEAHREGVIEVEGLYNDGSGALYYLFQLPAYSGRPGVPRADGILPTER